MSDKFLRVLSWILAPILFIGGFVISGGFLYLAWHIAENLANGNMAAFIALVLLLGGTALSLALYLLFLCIETAYKMVEEDLGRYSRARRADRPKRPEIDESKIVI